MSEQTESCNGDNTPYVFENVLSVTVNDGNMECGLDNRVEQSEPFETPQKWSVSDYTNAINERYLLMALAPYLISLMAATILVRGDG